MVSQNCSYSTVGAPAALRAWLIDSWDPGKLKKLQIFSIKKRWRYRKPSSRRINEGMEEDTAVL